jgi:hypothetical protein
MQSYYAAESAVIDARPEVVYGILADYREEHPRILPPRDFPELVVERGGQGAGTVFRVRIRALGAERTYQMEVAEPYPGRVLVEEDRAAGVRTMFTVIPLDGGRRSQLRIETHWTRRPGPLGLAESMMNPPIARGVFRRELRLIQAYVGSRQDTTPATPGV